MIPVRIPVKRKHIAIGGTFACAIAIGFMMQLAGPVPAPATHGQAALPQPPQTESRPEISMAVIGTDDNVTVPAIATAKPVTAATAAESGVAAPPPPQQPLKFEGITPTAAAPVTNVPRALPPLPKPQPASLRQRSDDSLDAPADPQTPQLGCNVLAQATETVAATVLLTVAAPCYPNERVTVHHNGLMFTESTDSSGNLSVNVPVLAEHAIFVLAFANGKGAVAQAHVPSLADYDRVALQWSGAAGLEVHALEFGAGYDDPGHVWDGSQRTGADADIGLGGFVTRLGDPETLSPQLVEVYTYPSGHSAQSGEVAMSIEAEVTPQNCARDVSAQVLELRRDGKLRSRDLVLSMPDCEAAGDFLVLNNLLDNLKIAAK